MAVETSSIKPTAPRKPPAVAPTKGESGQPGVAYGDLRNLKTKDPNASEMAHHFAGIAGKEHSNEGSVSKAGKPGYK